MEFLIKFTEKPKNEKRKRAIEIAKKCDTTFEDGIYTVRFNEINKNLRDLLILSSDWATTDFISGDGSEDSHDVERVINCCYRGNCGGICDLRIFREYNVFRLVEAITRYKKMESWTYMGDIDDSLVDEGILVKDPAGSRYNVYEDKILDLVKTRLKYAIKYCNEINQGKIIAAINTVPDFITIHGSRESHQKQNQQTPTTTEEEYDAEEDYDEEYEEDEEEEKFEGFTDVQIAIIKAKAELVAPIYAKALISEFQGFFDEYLKDRVIILENGELKKDS